LTPTRRRGGISVKSKCPQFSTAYLSEDSSPLSPAYPCIPSSPECPQAWWHMLQLPISPARRFNSRVDTPAGVWVDWRCAGHEDISRVRNLSFGGLFVETRTPNGLGSSVKLEFLVEEGQIRAHAIVSRVEPGRGLALRFTAVNDQDSPRLATLMSRFRQSS
jgi:hypothetical protein